MNGGVVGENGVTGGGWGNNMGNGGERDMTRVSVVASERRGMDSSLPGKHAPGNTAG